MQLHRGNKKVVKREWDGKVLLGVYEIKKLPSANSSVTKLKMPNAKYFIFKKINLLG